MKIEGAVPQVRTGHTGDHKGRGKVMDARQGLPPQQILDKTQGMPPETTAGNIQPPANGVIRNLQEAHFQGVANVRLQINFHERLELEAAGQANEAVAAGSRALVTGVRQQAISIHQEFGGLSAESDDTTDIDLLVSSFSEEIDDLLANLNSPSTSPGGLLDGIREAFSSFFEQFSSLDAFSTEPPATDGTDITGSVVADLPAAEDAVLQAGTDVEPASSIAGSATGTSTIDEAKRPATFAGRLSELQSWFNDTFAAMSAQVYQLLQPPSFGEPRGNGTAYSRFVAVYQEMYQVTAPGSTTATDSDSALTTTA